MSDAVARSAEPARGLRRVARHGAALLVGLGRGAWLFPLDVTFRVAGLRYTWLKALFRWTPWTSPGEMRRPTAFVTVSPA